MQQQDIEAELSYAYIHAVASRAGIACQATTRVRDNLGIDVDLSVVRDFGPDAAFSEITLHIQLKATTKQPKKQAAGLPYWLAGLDEYDRLRQRTALIPRLLAVLFLPEDPSEWLAHSSEQLVLCRCAYWLSLVDAPQSTNSSGQTVYLPEHQQLSPHGLLDLFRRVAHREELRHGS